MMDSLLVKEDSTSDSPAIPESVLKNLVIQVSLSVVV